MRPHQEEARSGMLQRREAEVSVMRRLPEAEVLATLRRHM
jgi:hypothetical protein